MEKTKLDNSFMISLCLLATKMEESDLRSLNHITSVVLDSAIRVHKAMGPGLLEGVYQECLIDELTSRGTQVATSVRVPLYYNGKRLTKNYVIDVLVEDEVIVELKAVDAILPVHEAQILTYLRVTNKRIGLLINFNEKRLIDGYRRFING